MGGFVDHFLYQNGPKMDPKMDPKLRKNETWARWTANGRPMGPQSLQNGSQWDPQSSQNAPPNPNNGALETPKLTKWTPKLSKWNTEGPQNFKINASKDDQANIEQETLIIKLLNQDMEH